MNRLISIDTETTGFEPKLGHRVIEIGCVELINMIPTKNHKQWFIKPDREIDVGATKVHGITLDKLKECPSFIDITDEFLEFIGDSPLVAHNAKFDVRFLSFELFRVGRRPLVPGRAIDTLSLTRRRWPGKPASLDKLCERLGVDRSSRVYHGALLDAQLLAECYIKLVCGQQMGLAIAPGRKAGETVAPARTYRPPRAHVPTQEELVAHKAMVMELKNAVWLME